jgi:hypothetical protein
VRRGRRRLRQTPISAASSPSSFIDAYSKMVGELGLVRRRSRATAEASPGQDLHRHGACREPAYRTAATAKGSLLRTLPVGAIVYPTGQKDGLWWEVADENDNVGWVLNTKLEPSR